MTLETKAEALEKVSAVAPFVPCRTSKVMAVSSLVVTASAVMSATGATLSDMTDELVPIPSVDVTVSVAGPL